MTDTTALLAPVSAPASTPIAEHGLRADCNSAALVDRAGSIDWLCLPRYDSTAIFARILGSDAGHWSIRPPGAFTSERRYLPGTMIVETTFTTDTGTVRLVDAMGAAEGQRGHDLGLDAPHEVLRSVEGEVEMVLGYEEDGNEEPKPRIEPEEVPPDVRDRLLTAFRDWRRP
jgi:GH15 family glucan-1,4-alpha-glucosidase